MRDSKSKQNMMTAEPLFINSKLNKTKLYQPKTKTIRGCLSSPPERSETERRGASSTLTSSLTLTPVLRSNRNNSEFPPVIDR